ncbi:MAG: 3-oxoadipate enol-lactonase [Actinomycetota bacterium]|jgi:pimeloyl-ACP methyl ester carboxylesterase
MNVTTVAAGGVEIVVREWGAGDGRPLVFWPGLNPFGALQLNEAGPVWAARGYRVLAVAAPGGGESPPLADREAYLPTRLARLVLAVADRLGLGAFVFVGWSWGASIGVHLAARHSARLRALVLLDAGHTDVELEGTLETLEREFARDQERYAFAGWDEYLDAVRGRARSWRPALEDRFRAGMVERDGSVVPRSDPRAAAWALHGVAAEPPSSTHELLGRLDLPILLVLGAENDTAREAAHFRAAVPHAAVSSMRSGHDLLADAPDETANLVGDWLAAVD